MRVAYLFPLALALTACPEEPQGVRGDVGYYCKLDGTCNYPTLECRNPQMLAGIPVTEPTCFVKEK